MESRRRRKPFRCWYTRVPSGQLSILSSTLFSVTLRRRETPLHAPSSTTFTLNSKPAEENFIFLIVPICNGRYRLRFYLLVVSPAFQAAYARTWSRSVGSFTLLCFLFLVVGRYLTLVFFFLLRPLFFHPKTRLLLIASEDDVCSKGFLLENSFKQSKYLIAG